MPLKSVERGPSLLRPLFRRVILEPAAVRRNMLEAFPKALFALVPIFAGIVRLFYWRPYPQHLIFALHLHAAIFLALTLRALANVTHVRAIVAVFELAAVIFVVAYSVRAFKTVYAPGWPADEAKYLDPKKMETITRTVLASVWALATADERPRIDRRIPETVPRHR